MLWIVGPWVLDGPVWRPPMGFSGLDLRSIPDQSISRGDPKLSVFFGDAESIENSADYVTLCSGSWTDLKISDKDRALLPSSKGYVPAGDTLQDALFDLLCNGADPLGLDCHKPLIPDNRLKLEMYAGRSKRSDRFTWGRGHTSSIRDLLRADFKDIFMATRGDKNPRIANVAFKVLDAYCEKYGVAKADWREFVPSELQQDVPGVLPHETTITEDFDRADSTSAMGHNLTWTQVTGTWGTTSNKGYKSSAANDEWTRAESALSSADHYAQVAIGAAAGVFGLAGPACRFAAAASTFYMTGNYSNVQYLMKEVAGARTNLFSVARAYAAEVLKVQANGSTIKAFAGGGEVLSGTDTSITGNLRTGLFSYISGETFDSFEAADLAAPGHPASKRAGGVPFMHKSGGSQSQMIW